VNGDAERRATLTRLGRAVRAAGGTAGPVKPQHRE